jgi:hypothetical protein
MAIFLDRSFWGWEKTVWQATDFFGSVLAKLWMDGRVGFKGIRAIAFGVSRDRCDWRLGKSAENHD